MRRAAACLGAGGLAIEPDEARDGRLALQQTVERTRRGIGSRRGLRHEALVDQRHGDLVPGDRFRRKRCARISPASCRRKRRGSRCRVALDRAATGVPATCPASASASSPRAAKPCQTARCDARSRRSRAMCVRRVRSGRSTPRAPRCRPYSLALPGGSLPRRCRIGSIHFHAASTSSRRMNSVWLPRTTSMISRS